MEAPMSELGPEARGILDEGRGGDDPTAADRARNRAALMRAIAAGGAGGAALASGAGAAATGASKVAGALSLGWKVAAALAVASAVGAGALWAHARGEANAPVTTATAATVAAAPPALVEVPEAQPPAPAQPASAAPVARAEPAPSPPRVAVVKAPRRPEAEPAPLADEKPPPPPPAPIVDEKPAPLPAPEDTLPAETQRLREAHGALQGGDPARALALLDEKAAAGAQLHEEREAARALALCQLGRVEEGRAAAERFLRESPRSPLADRVRAACAAAAKR
jgi:outer membrane biosynthesis protein TonB